MKIVTYICIDCKTHMRTDRESRFNVSRDEYRCPKCAAKKRSQNPIWLKNISEAIKKKYSEDEEYKNNNRNRMKNWMNDPVWKENQRIGIQRRSQDPKFGESVSKGLLKKFAEDTEYKEKHDKISKELSTDLNWINKQHEGIKKRSDNEQWLLNVKLAAQNRSNNPVWRENNKIGCQKRSSNPEYIEKHIIGHNTEKYKEWNINHLGIARERLSEPAVKKKMSESALERCQTVEFIERMSGEPLWYGHHILTRDGRTKYCELWNDDLKQRIDAAYDYKSILSGKTRFDNNGRALTRHHLYWQEKACCVWDEDINGYYAWISNNGKKVKYYIKGDPNKFVLLTDKEHGVVKGKKGTTQDRIYWIMLLEDLVNERAKYGKKCYLTPEEYEVYKVEHADVIAKYKK